MKKSLFTLIVVALLFVACEQSTEPVSDDDQQEIGPIHKYLNLFGDGGGRVTIGNYEKLQLTNTFTVELLINARKTYRRAFLSKSKDRYKINYSLGSGTWNQPYFQIKNGTVPITAHDTTFYLVPNSWSHLAGVFTNHEMKLYVNGELINIVEMSATPDTSGNLYIGWPGDEYFWLSECDGMIDEVRIWSIARTQNQIKEFMIKEIPSENREGLIGYWNFENIILQSDGTTLVKDLSGQNFNGKLEGNATIEGY